MLLSGNKPVRVLSFNKNFKDKLCYYRPPSPLHIIIRPETIAILNSDIIGIWKTSLAKQILWNFSEHQKEPLYDE